MACKTPDQKVRDAENAALRRGVRNGYGLMTDPGVVRAALARDAEQRRARATL